MASEPNPFGRWQRIAMDQLGYVLNLFLTFTVAALAYWFTVVKDPRFAPSTLEKCLMIASFIGLAVAAVLGVLCVVNRLRDFRGTAQRASRKPDAPTEDRLRQIG